MSSILNKKKKIYSELDDLVKDLKLTETVSKKVNNSIIVLSKNLNHEKVNLKKIINKYSTFLLNDQSL